jgi:hypothetical protein
MVFATGKDAVAAAYDFVYDKYHGFFVKQIFKRSFDAAPGADEILSHMNRSYAILQRSDSNDSDGLTEAMTSDDDSIAPSADDTVALHPSSMKNPLDLFVDHIAGEWMKLERFVSQCNGAHADPNKSRDLLTTSSVGDLANVPTITERSASAAAAEEEIPSFIAAIHPVLRGLDKMINQFNMNDPSKC